MDIKKTAIVTAIFDIGRDKWDNFTMSYHTYLWWMRNLLYLDTNLIIYTEEKFKDDILKYRKEVDPKLNKTILIIQPLESIEGYKTFYEPLNNLMTGEQFKSDIQFNVPEMTKPLYNVVMFAKLFYILDAAKKNLFDADLYAWADAGVIRNDNPDKNVKWPDIQKINELDNNKVTFFCHHPYVRVGSDQYKQHALSQMRYIQGGAVFVPKKCINDVCELFKITALDCIEKGFVGSDEKIFDFVYLTNPDNYNLIKCGWREYIDLFTTKKDLEVVVARYNEDVNWVKELNYNVTIYNKNNEDNDVFSNNLPNVGREGHTFFHHIVTNYDNLPEYIAFVQGKPHDHCPDIVNTINNFDFKTEFKPLGVLHELTMEYEAINQQVETYAKTIGFDITYPIYMTPGAQYIISRRLIKNKPLSYYEKILNTLTHNVYPQSVLDIEKTLFQIYGIYKP
jgi:protein YibB